MNDMRNQQTVGSLLDLANVKDGFEQMLLAYKEHRWDDLLAHLAPQPRTVIAKTLKENGQQYIIDAGEIPRAWQYQHAMPISDNKFHAYGLMANQNHGDSDEMYMFRFVFVRAKNTDEQAPQWLLHSTAGLGETEYNQGIYACLQWAPEHYYYPEDRD